MKKHPLEGRIAKIFFDSGLQFRIDFLADNQLRWTSIREEDAGATDVETIHIEEYPGGIFSIDWVEKDGLCVSYTVDTANSYVKSFMTFTDEGYRGGRRPFVHEGPFQLILENGEPDLEPLYSQLYDSKSDHYFVIGFYFDMFIRYYWSEVYQVLS